MGKNERHLITSEMRQNADRQLNELQREIKYDTKDYTVEVLFSKKDKGDIVIPEYQRQFIWRPLQQASFIESVLLGLPIPLMFFCEREGDAKLEVIDGAQRIQTLVGFIKDEVSIASLPKLSNLKGFKFSDLSEMHKRKFINKSMRVVVLDDSTQSEVRQDIFNRINASGTKINDSEMRRGSYPGKFTDFIDTCCQNDLFRNLCPVSPDKEKRYERFELVLRFFAYVNEYEHFDHRVSIFLDDFLKLKQHSFDEQAYSEEFNHMLKFAKQYFSAGFAKSKNAKSTPRVRFEALAVGTALALRKKPTLSVKNTNWIDNSKKFDELTTADASNNQGELKKRVEFVRDRLLKDAVHV
ncbi:hypothetical protein FACS1894139_15540 [Planctomycetales bacterium]|nr:hypothetical protein FACS1894107_04750 [Planctomycetales bacterium]GHS98859.1 hypothetical protein FACS1894108_07760 [Planctomycetales bacterium]GHT07359.1 hypothetical protein FACS1894139_15540 [Planctomycetales bacterium]